MATKILIQTRQVGRAQDHSAASFTSRFLAFLLDFSLCLSIPLLAVLFLRLLRTSGVWIPNGAERATAEFGESLVTSAWEPEKVWSTLGIAARVFISSAYFVSAGLIYFTYFEASPWQATLGKRLLSVYVADAAGQRICILQSIARWFLKWISLQTGLFCLSVLMIAVDDRHQALHDWFAKTLVLQGRTPPVAKLEWWRIALILGLSVTWVFGVLIVNV